MVQGLDQLTQRWSAIPGRVREAARQEMEKIADEIVTDMRRVAPKEDGLLAASIGWTWGDAPAGSMTVGNVFGREYGTMRIVIHAGNETTIVTNEMGERFQNAALQEHGTAEMPANPFFFPVWRARRRSVKGRITRAINKAIRNA